MSFGKGPKVVEGEDARALAEVAVKRYNRYQQVFVPLENQYISEVFQAREQPAYEMAGAVASAPYAREFAGANRQLEGGLFGRGIDPSSGAFQNTSAALRRAAAVSQGMGVAGAKVANTDRFYSGLRSIIAMGQGQASDAMKGLGDIAANSQNNAISAVGRSFDRISTARGVAGTALGLTAAPYVDSKLGPKPAIGGG